MISVTTEQLLNAWEEGLSQTPSRRVLSLLSAAYPDMPHESLRKLSIGHRDDLLLGLRESLFGSKLTSLSPCPACSEQLELILDIADIRITPDSKQATEFTLSLTNYQINYRIPNSQDLLLVETKDDLSEMRKLLLERCLLSIKSNGQEQLVVDLPDDILTQIEDAMAEVDPQANVQLNLDCPTCHHHWSATFDIASFLWCEINFWAKRILHEVHVLAKAYGWPEREILSLSSKRRNLYLSLLADTRGA